MNHTPRILRAILWVSLALALCLPAGCGEKPAATSEAAQTAAATPSDTVTTSATATSAPMSTMAPPTATLVVPAATAIVTVAPTGTETALPAYLPDEAELAAWDYSGWTLYENAAGFSLRLPADWTLTEVTDPNNTMAGHRVDLTEVADPSNVIHIGYRRGDEDVRITPGSMSQGEIVSRGEIVLLGQPILRQALVDRGIDARILYGGGGEIDRGALVLWVDLYRVTADPANGGLGAETQGTADAIISSLQMVTP